ncbi:ATP-dependent RNA helicase DHX33-like [Antedon mediterranea]|uniref:ATP-dependent RNA helicase DHX33-like n=1 Tax=Antedon mediterranea TaxID=105859 RepID=UPI003AF9B5F9
MNSKNSSSFNRKRSWSSSNGGDEMSIANRRKDLPIYTAKQRFLAEIRRTYTAIVIGETGSGKTTQIPQYLLESGLAGYDVIACTQPRRVAAITIAERVALEQNSELGEEVGYCVRFDDCTSSKTRIKYMTDGMLLRESILDPVLKKYSIIILDEAHERTVHTDVLLGIVKGAQEHRTHSILPPLKVIVMSATMDVDHFSRYFNHAPVFYIQGRQHPIQLFYANESQSDYIHAALVAIFQIHQKESAEEDILVFLTGQEEIESLLKAVKDVAQDCPDDCPGVQVLPLYASLPPSMQLKIFNPAPRGRRKIILSTNIAETSVTIPGIKHVIDTGRVKAKSFKAGSGLDILKVQRISQAQAWQRMGRAGRERSGVCWRLYTEEEYENLKPNTVPEIQRSNLSSVVLHLLTLNIRDVLHFDFLDPPSQENLIDALNQLELLGAIYQRNNNELTSVGKQMSVFPLEPRLAKILISSRQYSCLEEVLTIVSMLSVESILVTPNNKREEAHAARKKFLSSEGDHMTYLNIFRAYRGVHGNKDWCHENFVNSRSMKQVEDIRKQLRDLCVRENIPRSTCGKDTTSIRKCLTVGLFMNSAELQRDGTYKTLDNNRQTVSIHPSSCLFQCKPAYVLYQELVHTSKCYMRNLCVVDPDWLNDVAPSYFRNRCVSR